MKRIIRGYIQELKSVLDALSVQTIHKAVEMILQTHRKGGTIFVVGNGGSASTSSHFVCDLGKGTAVEGKPRLKVISLADNLAILTAWANDVSYDVIFAEQLRNLMRPGDLLIAISASGNSPNVLKAAEYARQLGCKVIGLTGFGGGRLASIADLAIIAESHDYGPVEDVHLVLNHIICRCIHNVLKEEGDV